MNEKNDLDHSGLSTFDEVGLSKVDSCVVSS